MSAGVLGALLLWICTSAARSEVVLRPGIEPNTRRARWWSGSWSQADSDRVVMGFRWAFGAFGLLLLLVAVGGAAHGYTVWFS